MADPAPNILRDGKGVFMIGDPTTATHLKGSVDYVAVMVSDDPRESATANQIQTLIDNGMTVVIWQQTPTQGALGIINQFKDKIAGYIGGGEGSGQIAGSYTFMDKLPPDLPKAIVTDGNYTPTLRRDVGVFYEHYPNGDVGKTGDNLVQYVITALREGAPFVTPSLGQWGWAPTVSWAAYQADLDKLRAALIKEGTNVYKGVSAYNYNMMTAEQQAAFNEFIKKYGPSAILAPTQAPPPQASIPVAQPPAPEPAKPSGTGIDNPRAVGTDGAPAAVDKYAPIVNDPNKTFSFTDRAGRQVTITTTSTGAKLEQVRNNDGTLGNAYRIGWDKTVPGYDQAYADKLTGKLNAAKSQQENPVHPQNEGAAAVGQPPTEPTAAVPTEPSAPPVKRAPGTDGAPPVVTKYAPPVQDPNKSYSFTKNGRDYTITTTKTGAILEQVKNKDGTMGNAYRVGWDNSVPGYDQAYADSLTSKLNAAKNNTPPYAAGVTGQGNNPNPTYGYPGSKPSAAGPGSPVNSAIAPYLPTGTSSPPGWRTNPNWGVADQNLAQRAGLNPSQILEQRPGANGNTIFRKDDGTYWNYNPNTGATSAAGTWNNRAGTSALGSGSGGGGNSFGAPPPSYTPYTPPPQQGAEYNTQIANVNGYNASGEYVGGMDGTIPPGELLAGSTP